MAALAGSSPALAGARIPAAGLSSAPRASFLVLPPLPRRSFSTSSSNFSDASRFSSVRVRASSSSEETSSSIQTDDLLADLKEKWDAIENKSTVFVYGGGAIIALWLSSVLVGAINSVPLLPKILELVGLGYTGWFVYRYLLFKSSRKELVDDIEDLKKKIAGTGE